MKRSGLALIPLAVLAAALFGAGALVRRHVAGAEGPQGVLWAGLRPLAGSDSGMEPKEVFETVLHSLESDYVDKITDEKKLTYGAVQAMVDALDDPYSQFLTPERLKVLDEAEHGQFHGLGAIVLLQRAKYKDITYERLRVANVLPGSPAEKSGIVPGDIIVRIDGRYFFQLPDDVQAEDIDVTTLRDLFPLADENDDRPLLTYRESLDMLSEDGKTLPLTIQHAGSAKTEEIKVALGPTQVPIMVSRISEPGVGYLAVRGFTRDVHLDVAKALKSLSDQGAKSIVLDLRGSFGGRLDEAKAVAGLFMNGPMGYVVHQKAGTREPIAAAAETPFAGRLVVLVDGATLGTSELVAAALSEQGHAPLVGTATFGDGLDQTLFPLADGSALELTTGKLLTATGLDFQQKGIKPTTLVAGAPARQLETAVALARTTAGTGA